MSLHHNVISALHEHFSDRAAAHAGERDAPLLPTLKAYLDFFVDPDESVLTFSDESRDSMERGRLLGFTSDLVFNLEFVPRKLNGYMQYTVTCGVEKVSAVQSVEFAANSEAWRDPLGYVHLDPVVVLRMKDGKALTIGRNCEYVWPRDDSEDAVRRVVAVIRGEHLAPATDGEA